MAEPARSDATVRPDRVVRPLSRAAARRCSRPGCPTPATATLAFRYDQQQATLVPLLDDSGPETYDLCGDHADRTRPPHGWQLRDDRPDEPEADTPDASDLGSQHTVAVLAAALRGEPARTSAPDQPAGATPEVDTAALDAIADEPFDEPDLFAAVDEADPVADSRPAPRTAAEDIGGHDDEAGVVGRVPARTVPGAHRPA